MQEVELRISRNKRAAQLTRYNDHIQFWTAKLLGGILVTVGVLEMLLPSILPFELSPYLAYLSFAGGCLLFLGRDIFGRADEVLKTLYEILEAALSVLKKKK